MKLKEGFVLREIAGSFVVVNLKGSADLRGMVTLNETGAFLWRALEGGGDAGTLADALVAEYGIDRATALADATAYLDKLKAAGVLE